MSIESSNNNPQGLTEQNKRTSLMYLMIFKCILFKKILIQQEISESQVLTVRKEELGIEEGDFLLSKWEKLLINTE